MTKDQAAEYHLLKMANEHGKIALQVGLVGSASFQLALERLQLRRWVTLIDLTPIAEYPERMFRVFLASEEAMTWFRLQG